MWQLLIRKLFAFVFLSMISQLALSAPATKDEAIAIVKKAVAYVKTSGKEKAIADFNNPKGQFVDRELYIVAIDLNGIVLAHGANPKLIGKQLLDVKDVNGKYFVQEQVGLAKTKEKGWVDFHWNNPVSQKIEPRSVYLERLDDYIILSGVFNQ